MVKLRIVNKNNYEYELKDEEQKTYNINIEFLGVEIEPKIGDYIYISAELLNTRYSGYSNNYVFGELGNKYGKENINLTDIDVIKVVTTEKEIYLKRLYG